MGAATQAQTKLEMLNRDVQQAGGESGARGEGHKGATGVPGSGEGLITTSRPQEAAKWAGPPTVRDGRKTQVSSGPLGAKECGKEEGGPQGC